MFEKQREKKEHDAELKAEDEWRTQRLGYAHFLELAQAFHGTTTAELVLKKGEALFAKVGGASLVEDRRGPGTWKGGNQGFSIPVGRLGGRTIRYHVGATRGHYIQGEPVPTAIDAGNVFVTNRRVVFTGKKQTRECLFDKLLSCDQENAGESIFSVSNRQKNTVIHYGANLDDWFRTRYAVAFADYQGSTAQLVHQIEEQIASLDASRPTLPSPPAPAQWASDPFGRHELRYSDGTKWTEQVSDNGVTGTDVPQ
jgi:hypothetical protein